MYVPCLVCPVSNILHLTFSTAFKPDVQKKKENTLLQKQKQNICNGETFRGSFTMQPVKKIVFEILYVDPCSEKQFLFHTPHFPSSQSLSKVLQKSTVTTSISLFKTPLHSLGWVSVTQTINIFNTTLSSDVLNTN